ncbi:MAG: winged helix-turn-helix domain-containing protein [Lutispora sp.]|jgi:molybdate transport system regulatory protein|uniref:winged helix-turn-helix domain-containing protein n=1 Tax=Lutispora sp. TaxID=2828727 RepID=UPI00356381E5
MKPGYSLWIKNDNGDKVFGQGPYRLLLLVDNLGSLNKAASEMGMAYSKALNIIKNAEEELNMELLEREIGGAKGGGSKLTKEAKELIDKYERFRNAAVEEIEKIYEDIFCRK